MTDAERDNLIDYLCGQVFDLQGRLRANEIVLQTLLAEVCENNPVLIESLPKRISDICELSREMNDLDVDIAVQSFEKEIKQTILRFDLIRNAVELKNGSNESD